MVTVWHSLFENVCEWVPPDPSPFNPGICVKLDGQKISMCLQACLVVLFMPALMSATLDLATGGPYGSILSLFYCYVVEQASSTLHHSVVMRPPLPTPSCECRYASYTFWSYVLPAPLVKAAWMPLFAALGLNQDNTTTDPTTAVGIGNLVGAAGFKQLASTNWNAQVC
jgi:hypothetical protein